MQDQIKNMLIGFFVVIAIGLVVGMILFIEPSVGDGKQVLVVRFSNITGINVGTRVLFAGRPIGEVSKIERIPHAREQPIDHSGNIYYYQLVLHIDSAIHVLNTDEIGVQTSGLLGEKSIGITPKAPPKGVKPKVLTARDVVYAESMDPLENAFNELSDLAERVDEAIDNIMGWFNENKENLSYAVASFGEATHELGVTMKDFNDMRIIEDVQSAVAHISGTFEVLDAGLHQMQKDRFFVNLGITMQNIRGASSSLKLALKDISDGRGTIGRLVTNDDMYLRFNSIFN